MTHYYCDGGCRGVADRPGTCQAETCPKHAQPLIACDCEDASAHEQPSIEKPTDKH